MAASLLRPLANPIGQVTPKMACCFQKPPAPYSGVNEASNPGAEASVAIVGGRSDDELLEVLHPRKGGKMHPKEQRALLVNECAAGDAGSQLKAVVDAAGQPGITVVSANLYYGQCTVPGDPQTMSVDPARTFAAVEALFAAGADVVCMQEVVGPVDMSLKGGKDSYSVDFFPKEAFAPWPAETEAFEKRAGVKFIYAAAEESTMYRHSFGNAIAVKTLTLKVVDLKTQPCLTPPTEVEGFEGRAAVTVVVQPVRGGSMMTVCCTHLTEKKVGENGEKQSEMVDSLLAGALADPKFAPYPTVLCGDFNINNCRGGMPPKSAAWCLVEDHPFLHAHTEHDPYDRLQAAGFVSSSDVAVANGSSLYTGWNGGIVDYNGWRNGASPLAMGCVDPTHNGQVVSDHRWPVVVYRFP